MATFSSIQRQHVLQAIAEHDDRGAEAFLGAYGFDPQPDHVLLHDGGRYDLRALLGVAHKYATGRLATSDEFSSMDTVVAILRRRGFEVVEPAGVVRATPPRTTTPRAPRAPKARATRAPAATEAPVAICPTCFTALPATGICDNCS